MYKTGIVEVAVGTYELAGLVAELGDARDCHSPGLGQGCWM